jgi:tetratricopeptide (TPR) repeat protein/ADP-heptose:LPS heptosyltransferase
MAQAQAALGLDSLAGIDARMQAISKLEALSEEIDAALARRKSNGLLRRGIKAWRRGDIVRATQYALDSTEADETNAKAFHVLAMGLERMGHQHKALVTYEHAFQLDPTDPELLINLGLTAWKLKLKDGAKKMFQLYIGACPDSPLGYNNLGTILSDMGDVTTAIDTLRAAIYRMPDQSILWNSLATVLAEDGRSEEALVFYQEAIRLEPQFARLHHNIGYAYSHLGRLSDALESYDRALEFGTDPTERIEATHSRGVCLIGMGRIAEGFRDYEIRNNERFRAYVHHMVKAPQWKGEPLAGKRIVVVGEQGLGDELMFANILPDVAKAVGPEGRLQIVVDKRLVPLYARSFPDSDVGTYDDRTLIDKEGNKELRFLPFARNEGDADYWIPMGSAVPHFRKTAADFPHQAFLTPDPARVAAYRKQLEALGPGPYVGVCWRSMMLTSKRAKYFSALEAWGPVLKTPGATFVNVQYGDCQDELARAQAATGTVIHQIEGLDLKNDLEGAAALSAALDLVLSAPTAAAAIAGSVGTEVWFLAAGRTWPQLGTDEYPWYRKTHVFSPEKFGDWTALMPEVAAALAKRVPTSDTAAA